jgi:hypothetical protein
MVINEIILEAPDRIRLAEDKEEWRSLWNTVVRKEASWEDNVNVDINEIRWEGVGRKHLAQDRGQCRALLNTEMSLRVA